LSRKVASHWVWSPYSTERGLAFAVRITGLAPEVQRKVLRGEPLGRSPRISVTETTPGRFRDVLGAPVGILFVAPALREVLEESGGGRLEFASTSVRGHPELRYFMVNVLDTVPAIDLDRSKYEVFPGTDAIRRIQLLRLRAIPASAPPIFHAAEDPPMILVSDDLKRRLSGASDHPGVLVRADKYRNEY
jgi:hypothetical protein